MFSFAVARVNIACASNGALEVEDADVEKDRKTATNKCCAHSGTTRERALSISWRSDLLLINPVGPRQCFGRARSLFFSAAADDDHK